MTRFFRTVRLYAAAVAVALGVALAAPLLLHSAEVQELDISSLELDALERDVTLIGTEGDAYKFKLTDDLLVQIDDKWLDFRAPAIPGAGPLTPLTGPPNFDAIIDLESLPMPILPVAPLTINIAGGAETGSIPGGTLLLKLNASRQAGLPDALTCTVFNYGAGAHENLAVSLTLLGADGKTLKDAAGKTATFGPARLPKLEASMSRGFEAKFSPGMTAQAKAYRYSLSLQNTL
jgi:hypothetical protein